MLDVAFVHGSPARSFGERRAPRRDVPGRGRASSATIAPKPALHVIEPRATVEEWLRIPEEKRAELIQGRIVYHAFPGVKHGDTQAQISHFLRPYRRRRTAGSGGGGADELGGWWLSQEVDMVIGDIGCRPDIVGWRRDKHARVPQPDARGVVTETPDFICEVLSASTARYDAGEKLEAYFRAGVPHYWMADPAIQMVTILEHTARGYLIVKVAVPGETVRIEPFEGVEIVVDELFLDEEGEQPAAAEAKEAPSPAPVKAAKAASRRRSSKT
jgi:Uma2 family endonuclease